MINWLVVGALISQFLIIGYLLRKCDEYDRGYRYVLQEVKSTEWKQRWSSHYWHPLTVPGFQISGRTFRVDDKGNIIEVEKE